MRSSISKMTPRERVLATMRREEVDYVPCLPVFNPLHERQRVGYPWQFPWGPSERERCEYQLDVLGVDAHVHVEIPAVNPEPGVSARAWMEGDTIHKVWTTPSGELTASAKYNDKWPHGLDIPFFSDFLIGHCKKRWLATERDVDCLAHLIRPPDTGEALERVKLDVLSAQGLADRLKLPVFSSVGLGLTAALQLAGATEACLMAAEHPDVLHAWIELEHSVNLKRIDLAVDLGVDAVIRNGFYETCDFYGPAMLEDFLGERLRKEGRVAREAGIVTSYTINTGVLPMLDLLATLEFDNFNSIDIAFEGFDLAKMRDSQGERRSYWIGPSSVYHLWKDDEDPTRRAVRRCFEALGKRGLLIRACPSAHSIMPWKNTLAMIDEWRKLR